MTRVLAAALGLLAAAPLSAQSYKSVVETRRVAESGPLSIELTFAVGELLIRPGDNGRTYRLAMTYAEDLFTPQVGFDAGRNRLTVELDGNDRFGSGDIDASDQRLDLALPRDVPLDLDVTFGALEADIELGDVNLRSAEFSTGASEATISFARPNRGPCRSLQFAVGAAEFEALHLGNARCRSIEFKGGVGEVVLDFSGAQPVERTNLSVTVGLGEVTIRVPASTGIRLEADRFLASVDHEGLVKRGSHLESPGYDDAGAKLNIEVRAVLGSIRIERIR